MPLDTIYLTRHGHRLNWTIDLSTGTYKSQFPTPTGNPADPALTSYGIRQSHELGKHINNPEFHPKPFRVYSSPFYRCLQTIQPSVEELDKKHKELQAGGCDASQKVEEGHIDPLSKFDVRIENGLGEWFGPTTFFEHPPHPTTELMHGFFPSLVPEAHLGPYKPLLRPSRRGETILELHNRAATTLAGIIADLDSEITALEVNIPPEQRTSKSVLICSHAATLIAMGRVLTGFMPEDTSQEDFFVFTAGMSTFRRRGVGADKIDRSAGLAEGTELFRAEGVPEWMGRGVGGGWECLKNGDCSFLSGGAERGWHFNGEESFDTAPMPPAPEPLPTKL
ncbi:Histidine phosphatase superfamily clade-1 [Penicillium malachiteum]|nr:Histidine phosphatase superfamily clade-1 [Penicillium malachiteum]